jgi:hypothetical protein
MPHYTTRSIINDGVYTMSSLISVEISAGIPLLYIYNDAINICSWFI